MTQRALVVGYGNSLRSDDGIGPAAIMGLADGAAMPDVRFIACHQLTPELARCFAAVDLVVLVDAAIDIEPGEVVVREIHVADKRSSELVHSANPAALVDLAARLYGRAPEVFLVTVGVGSLELGEVLSEPVAAALPEAIAAVRRLLVEHRQINRNTIASD
jgi:hydrogenase maturation protease